MSGRTIVVAHREMMVAEGIAAALARFPSIIPIAVATTAAGSEQSGGRAHAVALDRHLPGAGEVADKLRARGVRVVFIGEPTGDEADVSVSPSDPVATLASALVPDAAPNASTARLTAREQEILTLIGRGLAAKQVAKSLGISPKTVEQHKSRIFAKLGVRNQTAAVSIALAGEREPGTWAQSTT
ncbi:MAG: response regulator transcription factor [Actinomycetota bacterium]|nr:response regulator transcription factor [Actinomycetota bacterium]